MLVCSCVHLTLTLPSLLSSVSTSIHLSIIHNYQNHKYPLSQIIIIYQPTNLHTYLPTTQFLKAAAKKRHFHVIVCEGAPHFGGHQMAKSLADAGINTTVIHDAATFAIMARVNKVLLPSHAVLVRLYLLLYPNYFLSHHPAH